MSDWDFLRHAYKRENFKRFLAGTNAFSEDLVAIPIRQEGVSDMYRLGEITTSDGKNIAVFEVEIDPKTQLSRNRVELRNLVLRHVKRSASDGALAVYIDEESKTWRLSFISIKARFDREGNLKVEESDGKRFTYLLGENMQTRTVRERLSKITSESSLDDITEAFAVEPLTREFFEKLHNWYERAQRSVAFPNDEGVENHIQISLIRLLTRLLFVWFIKERGLVSGDLFNKKKLESIIHWDKPSSYYKAILQNLFFATLNRHVTKRGCATKNSNFVGNLFRYHKGSDTPLFKINNGEILKQFKHIPFLNGGLFDCLDRELLEDEKSKYPDRIQNTGVRIDGFSSHKKNPLRFDNDLFFNEDKEKLGLINILKQYNFTSEESTPSDIQVALDPELLGKVFENLLATYNPETKRAARNETGSFYTPREIVGYMVNESIKKYLKKTTLTEKEINALVGNSAADSSSLGDEKCQEVVKAIDEVKIIDPAVGSGAFAMGVLHKLVDILTKVDEKNIYFKEQQLSKAREMQDEESKNASIAKIEEIFSAKNQYNSYGKKLFLIENCIYGVDIQPIAIQICKLRFFITLVVEQAKGSIDKNDIEGNYGIKALPNLETKFIAADTLAGLNRGIHRGIFAQKIEEKEKKLLVVRHDYFNARTLEKKRQCREKDREIREEIAELLKDSNNVGAKAMEDVAEKISSWDPYNQNLCVDWFNAEWQFGVVEGFDVVIGNPPYKQVNKGVYSKEQYPYAEKIDLYKQNLYKLFVEQAHNIVRDGGVVTMIVQSTLMCDISPIGIRRMLLEKNQPILFVEFMQTAERREDQIFQSVTQGTCIYKAIKTGKRADKKIAVSINNDGSTIKNLSFADIQPETIRSLYPDSNCVPLVRPNEINIVEKLSKDKSIKPLRFFMEKIRQGDLNLTTDRLRFSENKTNVRLMRGAHVGRYCISFSDSNEYVEEGFKKDVVEKNGKLAFLITQQVMNMQANRRLNVALCENSPTKLLWGNSVNKILLKKQYSSQLFLCLLNSYFMDWYFRLTSTNNHIQIYELEQLPIPALPEKAKDALEDMAVMMMDAVSQIQSVYSQIQMISVSGKTDEHQADMERLEGDKKQLEEEVKQLEEDIDGIVYRLYGLDEREIAIIDPTRKKPKGKG